MSAPRVLLVVKDGWSARFLLRTDILPTLKAGGARVGILSPNVDEEYFAHEFAGPGTDLLAYDPAGSIAYATHHRLQTLMKVLRSFTLRDCGDNLTTLDGFFETYRELHRDRNPLSQGLLTQAIKLLRRFRPLREALYWAENCLYSGPATIGEMVRRFRPQVVVTVSMGQHTNEVYVMRQAVRFGAKLVTVVLSWDNDAKFGMAGVRPDLLLTWSDNLSREMLRCHDLDPSRVQAVGVPHFDVYARPERLPGREEFLPTLGLDPDPERKLLFFATKAPQNFPYNPDIVDIIDQAMREGRLAKPCQLLVRLHPQHYCTGYQTMSGDAMNRFMERYQEVCERNPHIKLNMPQILSNKLDMDRPASDMVELGTILKHSSVVINPFSTLNVEASIFDVPIVNVGFDGFGDPLYRHPAYRSIATDESHVHNRRMLATGCTRVAHSPEELITCINQYLLHPELDREGRRRLVEQECGVMDGQAGRRAGRAILEMAA